MKSTLLSGLAAALIAGYGVYDYTTAAPLTATAPAAESGIPDDLAKDPPSEAKEPGDLGTILD